MEITACQASMAWRNRKMVVLTTAPPPTHTDTHIVPGPFNVPGGVTPP